MNLQPQRLVFVMVSYYMNSSVSELDETNPALFIGHPSRQDGANLPAKHYQLLPKENNVFFKR